MKNIKNLILYFLKNKYFLFILFFIYGTLITVYFLIPSYNMDGYCQLRETYFEYGMTFVASGRFLTALFWFIFDYIDISRNVLSVLSVILSNLFLSFSILSIYKQLKILVKDKIINLLIILVGSVLMIYNPFTVEFFIYEESFCMCLSVFTIILAGNFAFNKKFLLSLVFLIISNLLYQGNISLFIPYFLILRVMIDKSLGIIDFFKKNFKDIFISCLLYAISMIVVYIAMKICIKLFEISSIRSGEINLVENIMIIFNLIRDVFKYWMNMLNPNVCNAILLALILVTFMVSFKSLKKDFPKFIYFVVIIAGSILLAFIPNIVMPTNSNYTGARMLLSVGATFGMIVIMSLLFFDNSSFVKKSYLCIVLIIAIVSFGIFSFESYSFSYYDSLRYQKDINYINEIKNSIKRYESSSGYKIKNIYYKVSDYNHDYYYSSRFFNNASGRFMMVDWGFECGMQGLVNNQLKISNMGYQKYEELFKKIDGPSNVLNYNRLIFEEESLFILLY